MSETKKRGPGRPAGTRKMSKEGQAYGGPEIRVRVTPDLAEWVKAQGGPAYVRQMLEQARAAAT